MYRQKQEEIKKQELQSPPTIEIHQTPTNKLNYSEQSNLSMRWFEFYKKAMLFFLIFNCLTSVNSFTNIQYIEI